MKTCSCEDCSNPVAKRGMCNAHYIRWRRYGDPNVQFRKSPGTVTDEDRKEWKRNDYIRHKDAYIARAKKNANHEKRKEYFARDDIKARARTTTKRWVEENPERKIAADKAYVAANPARVRSYKAKRRAKEKQATPQWLTPAQWAEIRDVYEVAEQLTQSSGTPYQVDHIVPLEGRIVCGLHVPWNLRAIPGVENKRRTRIWTWGLDPDAV